MSATSTPLKSYKELYSDPANDPSLVNGKFKPGYKEMNENWRTANAALDEDELLKELLIDFEDPVGALCAFVKDPKSPTGVLKVLTELKQHPGTRGQPSPHRGKPFAFEGDVMGIDIRTIAFQKEHLKITPEITVAGDLDRHVELLKQEPQAAMIGPIPTNAQSKTIIKTRGCGFMPFLLVHLALGKDLTGREAIDILIPHMRSLGILEVCSHFVEFLVNHTTKPSATANGPLTLQDTVGVYPYEITPDITQYAILDSIRPRQRRVATSAWHKVLGELRSMALAIPGARGLFSTLQEAFRHVEARGNRLRLNVAVHDFLSDFKWIANDLGQRPTRIAEIIPATYPTTMGASDAAGAGMGGVHFIMNAKTGKITPILWRARFPPAVRKTLVSYTNPNGTITNSDLELAGSISHTDVLANAVDIREQTIHNAYDNTPTVNWQRRSLDAMPTVQADAWRADLELVQEAVRSGVTSKRAAALDGHWKRWNQFCIDENLDPFLRDYRDPVPILQVFGQRYRDGRIAPRGKPVGASSVSDSLFAIGSNFSKLGTNDPRIDPVTGKLDFRIYRQLRAYKKKDPPPKRVKPVPTTIVLWVLHMAYEASNIPFFRTVADIIVIAFYFLLRPGEHTGTTKDDTPFLIENVQLYLGDRPLQCETSTIVEIEAATSVSFTFTTQKNADRNEVLTHGLSNHQWCCPTKAAIRLILYHKQYNTSRKKPLASYYERNKLHPIKSNQITEQLRTAAQALKHQTGLDPKEISARSLRAGGAMALLNANVDFDVIQMLGRWHSDSMMRHLHLQAQPVMNQFATRMFNNGKYSFLPTETVPIHN